MDRTKYVLDENDMPDAWYNVLADLPTSLDPPLDPKTRQPVSPEALMAIFPKALIEQEMSTERYIRIPREVMEVYRLWRPSPMYRARRLEQYLDTPARIYYKYEGVSPAGSHKPNTAVAQAYYNKKEGIRRLATETGAGQWGSALALACKLFDMACTVYMVRVSYEQKPYRKYLMNVWGAECIPSPSTRTNAGRAVLERDPDSPGSLGVAISEAVEDAATHEDTNYALGSVLNHVLLHQTIIGEEAAIQMEMADDYPDYVVGCVGGGSNFAGIALPFMREKLAGNSETTFVAVEPTACPTLTRGRYEYDFGDVAGLTPLLKMYTLGHDFIPPRIHAGGLRYHGDAPILSYLVHERLMDAVAYRQSECFEAASIFARSEGIVIAPETSHAVRAVIDIARECKKTGDERTVLFNLSGHGLLDLSAYDAYLSGELEDVNDR
ncbi:TrpB-like pyridoxal phosphate-dependent enzyme [Methermicoccus shengliensis]|uniref:Tryptophan synthase beta chain n=1 Tax=Methermicoccus shengliensis TaxID=660064 RepID=A0A832RVE9_9EURY|nr:TrpB-like pyridoxal phosphate-dependent enzyme [Methermicoccus shengliensis]KUK04376.1 MAG: Tryptophan synthase beta chain [Euryarchaeota archaeon 55_53]KUK30187.1 MAG: Tryptophan synthase beta chain [Methanosarcinales archeaon 56_1174]MDI3488448.1 tryptophan synthase beta chain [Methanosarcinales archaeon]MDN5295747.1 tryptophan synthase beta chain [Methanosarcinales archaeon]HIH69026.1 TrpB-like pyridoxal phosphate-dependent enzyme [Methermicoccus shengliensis]